MKKFKVEMTYSHTYCVDVLAKTEEEARELAEVRFFDHVRNGTEHYLESEDSVHETGTVYDVTNTDDPFNP